MAKLNDPKLYRELSEPFENLDEANAAIDAFNKDVRAARIKHGIPDAYLILAVTVKTSEGEEGECIISAHHGDSLKTETMTAWALGYEQSRRQERVYETMRGIIEQPKRGK